MPIFQVATKATQRAHGVRMTSYQRRCDVMTSHRRRSDVIMTSCACWADACAAPGTSLYVVNTRLGTTNGGPSLWYSQASAAPICRCRLACDEDYIACGTNLVGPSHHIRKTCPCNVYLSKPHSKTGVCRGYLFF